MLHAHQDQATGAASFDYASVFRVKMPILSMTTMTEDAAGESFAVLYHGMSCICALPLASFSRALLAWST